MGGGALASAPVAGREPAGGLSTMRGPSLLFEPFLEPFSESNPAPSSVSPPHEARSAPPPSDTMPRNRPNLVMISPRVGKDLFDLLDATTNRIQKLGARLLQLPTRTLTQQDAGRFRGVIEIETTITAALHRIDFRQVGQLAALIECHHARFFVAKPRSSGVDRQLTGDLRGRPHCVEDRKSTRLNSSHVKISY